MPEQSPSESCCWAITRRLTQPEYWSNIVCSALFAAGVHLFIEEVTPEQNWLTIINTDALSESFHDQSDHFTRDIIVGWRLRARKRPCVLSQEGIVSH